MRKRLGVLVGAITLASTAGLVPASAVGAAASSPALSPVPAGQTIGQGDHQAVITRDSYGVPSIYSKSRQGMWFGAGYAQAQDRLVQLELTRRTVEGTLSEIAGPSELSQDEDVRTFFYTPAELQAQERSLRPDIRRALSAYSDGINAYVASAYASPQSEKALVPYELKLLGQLLGLGGPFRPAPWEPTDTVAVGNYLARQFGGGGGSELQNLAFVRYLQAELSSKGDSSAARDARAIFNDSRWIDDPTAPTTVPGRDDDTSTPAGGAGSEAVGQAAANDPTTPDPSGPGTSTDPSATSQSIASLAGVTSNALSNATSILQNDTQTILKTGISLKVLSHGGSNAFAVAPWRSKDHRALLWGAPQEGFGTPSIDGEQYLHSPGYDAGGMDITGEPFILIGRNADLSWSTTSEELVDQRTYVEKVNFSTDPPTYLFDGREIPMQAIQEQIPVAGQAPQNFTVYRTIDGPVFSTDKAGGTAFSMRFAAFGDETGTLEGFAELGGDHNLAEFRQSMGQITTLHNFLYADRRGNIAFFGDGLVPIEPPFTRVDPRLPAVGDGSQQWLGFVPFDRMPHSVDPPQGFLDNWNTKPSQELFYQQNSGDEYWGTIFRSQRITELLQASTTIDIPYLEMVEHDIGTIDNGDNTRPAASYFIPYVVQAYHALGGRSRSCRRPVHPSRPGAGGADRRGVGRPHHPGQPRHVHIHELPGGVRAQRFRGRHPRR